MVDLRTVSCRRKFKIELTADSGEELFLAWLKELIFLSETQHLFLSEFKILDLSFSRLAAEVGGEKVNSKKHVLGKEVKAVTRHQFKFIQEPSRYFAEVVLDI